MLLQLRVYVPFLEQWARASPASFAFISGVLPPAVSGFFGFFLPIIIRWLTQVSESLCRISFIENTCVVYGRLGALQTGSSRHRSIFLFFGHQSACDIHIDWCHVQSVKFMSAGASRVDFIICPYRFGKGDHNRDRPKGKHPRNNKPPS